MSARAIVVGAGMGGLCAALALQQQGIEVEVYEKAGELREVGAGLTLSNSALKALHGLGLLDAVRAVSQLSARMPFVHYRTGELLWGEFAGEDVEPAVDGPSFVSRHIFRADLQTVLARALHARSPNALRLGQGLVGIDEDDDTLVTARFASGQVARGDILIGADGINSSVRAARWGAVAPNFTGQVAWRFLVDAELARPHMSSGRAAVFFGPERVFNRYLLRGGSLLNCVAIVRTPGWQGEGWSTPGDPRELASLFEDWHPDVRGLIGLASPDRLVKWALGSRPPLASWIRGRVALLGDSAHPMLPFLGLGAAMAIEDAALLGRAFAAEAAPLAALRRYQAARLPRTTAVAEASARQGEALQAKDPDHFRGDDAPVADRAMFEYDPTTAAV